MFYFLIIVLFNNSNFRKHSIRSDLGSASDNTVGTEYLGRSEVPARAQNRVAKSSDQAPVEEQNAATLTASSLDAPTSDTSLSPPIGGSLGDDQHCAEGDQGTPAGCDDGDTSGEETKAGGEQLQ